MSDQPRAIGDECPDCTAAARRGYCALGRCYCGHPACHGFASWQPLPDITDSPNSPARPTTTAPSTWDTREDTTWIDRL